MIFVPAALDELSKIASSDGAAGLLGENPTRRELSVFRKLLKSEPKQDVAVDKDADRYGGGYYDQTKKSIRLSKKDYEALAHEMGHAEIDKKLLGRLIQHPAARWLFNEATVPAAIGAGILLAAKGKKWGFLIPAATTLPTLISESLATHIGHEKLKDQGVTPEEQERYRDRLREAFKTYLNKPARAAVGAAGGGLGYVAIRELLKNLRP